MDSPQPRLLDQVRHALRRTHYSLRTEEAYVGWIKRDILFYDKRHLTERGVAEVEAYLTHLAGEGQVAASTQNQALHALLFLDAEVLRQPLDRSIQAARAKRPERLPTVLNREEVRRLLDELSGTRRLLAQLLYGSGLRLLECLRLRVQDLAFADRQITVRDGKGQKDRRTMLPASLVAPLQPHLQGVQAMHQEDVRQGYGTVFLPDALARKCPNAARAWLWQEVFPAHKRASDPRSGVVRRHHQDASGLQKAVRSAAQRLALTHRVTCHTLRHSFATQLLEDGYDIRTIQELLGHADIQTTMIYTHVLNAGGRGVRRPLDPR